MPEQEKAISTAAKWALGYPMLPSEFKACIQRVEKETQSFSKIQWHVRKRRIVVKQEPVKGRTKLEEPINPSAFDPWNENTGVLAERTSQVTTCETCNGKKKVTCKECNGSASIACPGCNGSGSDISAKTGNIINCRKCKGSGRKKCKCRTGLTKCLTCDGKGKARRWLEVEESLHQRVHNGQQNMVAKVLGAYGRSGVFSKNRSRLALKSHLEWSGTDPNHIPPDIQAYLYDQPMNPITSTKEERLEKVDVQVFCLSFFRILYEVAQKQGQISVSTDRFQVVTDEGSEKPLELRRGILATVGVLSLLLGLVTVGAYNSQHHYYSNTINNTLLTWLAFLFPIIAIPPTALVLIPNFGRFKRLLQATVATTTLFALLIIILFFTGGPSVAKALAYHQEGKLSLAMREAKACLDLRWHVPEAKKAHDWILLASIKGKPKEIFANMNKKFFSQKFRIKAEDDAFALITKKLRGLHRQGDYRFSEAWLRRFPKRLRSSRTSKALLLDAYINLATLAAKRYHPDVAFARLAKVPHHHRSRKDFRHALAQAHLSKAHQCAVNCQEKCFIKNLKKAMDLGLKRKDVGVVFVLFKKGVPRRARSIYAQRKEESCISFTRTIKTLHSGVDFNPLLKELYLLQARRCVDHFDQGCLRRALKHAQKAQGLSLKDKNALAHYTTLQVLTSIRKRGQKLRSSFTLEDGAKASEDLQKARRFFFKQDVKKDSNYRRIAHFYRYCQKVKRSWRAFRMRGLYYTTSSVRCNDGSYSSCSCNKLRGCCSHHRGVRGCEYTRHKKLVPASPVHRLWRR